MSSPLLLDVKSPNTEQYRPIANALLRQHLSPRLSGSRAVWGFIVVTLVIAELWGEEGGMLTAE